MKVLVLNASPRKNGTIEKLLKLITADIECEWINVCDLNINCCKGCMVCRSKGECILNDDANLIAQKIKGVQILIVGTPCWWGNMNGKLKMLFDRIVYVMMGESKSGIPVPLNKGKKYILATCCTTPFPFNILANQTTGVIRSIKEIMGYSGFKSCGTIQKGGTKSNKSISNMEKRKCASLNKRIKKMIKTDQIK